MNEDKIWFNQPLLYYRDKAYTINGVLEISLNNNTSDFQMFSSTALNLSISNDQTRKTQSLNYQNISDLISALETVIINKDNIYGVYSTNGGSEIVKKYSQDKNLRFIFKPSKSNQEKICIISISNNESDFTRVAITFDFVLVIKDLLKSFIKDYINININFINRCISTEVLNQIKNMRDSIKTLPSFLGSINTNNTTNIEQKEEIIFDSMEVEEKLNELDIFLGKDMSNITIPEIDNPKVIKEVITSNESKFITSFLRSDLKVLENIITATSLKENPFASIIENIQSELQTNESLIPEISTDDLKSLSYISKKIFMELLKRYTEFNEKIPPSFPVLKYSILDSTNIKEINKSLSIDLLLILVYLKNLKSRLEMRESNEVKNRSLFYISFRLFMDPLIFSFINSNEKVIIKSLLKDRFNNYTKLGFFDTYSKLLESYSLTDITERQILDSAEDILNQVNKCSNINIIHKQMIERKMIKIPYENKLTLEQIIYEAVPYELFITFNQDNIQDSRRVEEIFPDTSQEVFDYINGIKVDIEEKKIDKKSHIQKMCQFLSNEIIEKDKLEFLTYIKTLKKDNFDENCISFNINQLGDNILKTIYIWNNSDKNGSYSDFSSKVEECILDRNSILSSLVKKDHVDEVEEQDWSSMLDVTE